MGNWYCRESYDSEKIVQYFVFDFLEFVFHFSNPCPRYYNIRQYKINSNLGKTNETVVILCTSVSENN